jgi:hypothetical protein
MEAQPPVHASARHVPAGRVQFVDPVYRDRADQDTQGIGKFSLSSTTRPGSSGSWDVGEIGKGAGKCSLRKYGE